MAWAAQGGLQICVPFLRFGFPSFLNPRGKAEDHQPGRSQPRRQQPPPQAPANSPGLADGLPAGVGGGRNGCRGHEVLGSHQPTFLNLVPSPDGYRGSLCCDPVVSSREWRGAQVLCTGAKVLRPCLRMIRPTNVGPSTPRPPHHSESTPVCGISRPGNWWQSITSLSSVLAALRGNALGPISQGNANQRPSPA